MAGAELGMDLEGGLEVLGALRGLRDAAGHCARGEGQTGEVGHQGRFFWRVGACDQKAGFRRDFLPLTLHGLDTLAGGALSGPGSGLRHDFLRWLALDY